MDCQSEKSCARVPSPVYPRERATVRALRLLRKTKTALTLTLSRDYTGEGKNTCARAVRATLAIIPALLGFSCSVGPDYKRPPMPSPATYKSATTQEAGDSGTRQDWWTLFNDPQLNAYEESALAGSYDLRASFARVEEARAAAGEAKAGFFPTITADPSWTRERRGDEGIQSIAGSSGRTTNSFSAPLDLQYEVDLWGQVRRTFEAATAQTQAAINDFGFTRLELTTEVATAYFNVKSLDDQDQITYRNVALFQQQVDYTTKQNKVGLAAPTDLLQAQTQLYSTQSQLEDIRRQRAVAEHALAVLLGRPPSELNVAFNPLNTLPPIIPAGLPADLLAQRPDVAEAEQNLVAANAQIGVAVSEFYPQLNLSGAAGFESVNIGSLFDWENRFLSAGPSASFPIFEGGRLTSNLHMANARYDELLADYRSTVIGAFRDVEDALADLHHDADEADAQDKAVKSASEYLRLTQIQYEQGLVTYLQVSDADRTLLTNELSAAQLLNARMAAAVQLIRAIGGGWHQNLPPSTESVIQPTTQKLSD